MIDDKLGKEVPPLPGWSSQDSVGTAVATHDQQKPLLKMLRKLMQPRHPRTRKFVKPKTQRKTKRQQYY